MSRLKVFIQAYLSTAFFVLIVGYLVTAPRTGAFVFHWNVANMYLASSYLVWYPILNLSLPKWRQHRVSVRSTGQQSYQNVLRDQPGTAQRTWSSLNPAVAHTSLMLLNGAADDMIGPLINWLLKSLSLLLALPILIGLLISKGLKTRKHPTV